MTASANHTLVMVDDDPEDILLVKTAVRRSDLPLDVISLYDGDSLFAFLHRELGESPPAQLTPPMIVLLDLNMPRLDGRKCLQKIKQNPLWADLPVLIFSTSDAPDDIRRSYELNANSYICKPDDPNTLDKILSAVYRYWFGGDVTQ